MKLTDQQRDAISSDDHTAVVACPGSGKTRAIVAKILSCVDNVRDTPRQVACITYTKTAVYELEHRIRVFGGQGDEDCCEVSTIHAFCHNNILRHFHWLLSEYKEGFIVLPSDSDVYLGIADEIGEEYKLSSYARQQFELLNRKPNGEPISVDEIPKEAALEFWARLEAMGCIDFCNIVYYSYSLLSKHPHIAKGLASKLAYLLVDEFQDTSALQVEILKLISDVGVTKFFLVGDPEQSIFSFAGAERQLMFDFAAYLGAPNLPLSGNFRSSPAIIDCAESLISKNPRMEAVGDSARFTESPEYHDVANNFIGITERFLPAVDALGITVGNCAILAQSWMLLMPLGRQLRNYGIPVVGPGARPYKKRHLFVGLAEQICAYIDKPDTSLIKQTERELFHLINNITGRADFSVYKFSGSRVVVRLLWEGRRLKESHEGAVDWLTAASSKFAEILIEEKLLPQSCLALFNESAANIIAEMKSQGDLDVPNLMATDLGMFANPSKNLKLLTFHGAKGREFQAVALISVQDGRIPYHNKYNPLTQEGHDEAKRLLYVGITRAERMLMIFTDKSDWRNPSPFINDLSISNV